MRSNEEKVGDIKIFLFYSGPFELSPHEIEKW